MKTFMKATTVAVIAGGMILSFTPQPAIGGGCGGSSSTTESSGCQSHEKTGTPAPEATLETDDIIFLHATLGKDLERDIANLESRIGSMAARTVDDELRAQCDELRILVITIRDNMTQYHAMGQEILATMGHTGQYSAEGMNAAEMSEHGSHDH